MGDKKMGMTREEKINILKSRKEEAEIDGYFGFATALESAIKALEQEPRWILVSERLPEAEYGESDSVLVYFENGTQDVLYFDGSNWRYPTGESYISVNHKNGWHNKVIAWMPLPKSYEPKESEE